LTAVQAAGKYKETKAGAFVEAGLNFGISIIGVFKFGLIGVTFGTLVANTFRTMQYATFISKKLLPGRSVLKSVKRFLWLGINVVLIYLLKFILPEVSIGTWRTWIITAILYFAISMFVTMTTSVIFYRDDLKSSFDILKKMIRR
jgi:hypothetical protein